MCGGYFWLWSNQPQRQFHSDKSNRLFIWQIIYNLDTINNKNIFFYWLLNLPVQHVMKCHELEHQWPSKSSELLSAVRLLWKQNKKKTEKKTVQIEPSHANCCKLHFAEKWHWHRNIHVIARTILLCAFGWSLALAIDTQTGCSVYFSRCIMHGKRCQLCIIIRNNDNCPFFLLHLFLFFYWLLWFYYELSYSRYELSVATYITYNYMDTSASPQMHQFNDLPSLANMHEKCSCL